MRNHRQRNTRLSFKLLIAYCLPAFILIFLISLFAFQTDISFGTLFGDTVTVNEPLLTGFFSTLGILGWCATAAILVFTWAALPSSKSKGFYLHFGILTILLLLDDLFLLHERLEESGYPEESLLLAYALFLLFGLWHYQRHILASNFLTLGAAFGLFTLSVGIDVIQFRLEQLIGPVRIVLEDGFKFLGIVAWLGYFARMAYDALRQPTSKLVNDH